MEYVVVRTHVVNHERFLEAGPLARDLWQWGMLYAGQHETDGELPMVAVLSSPWGHGGKRNVVLADKLVEVGLWERTDRGYRVRKWAEMGNKTRAQIDEARAAARARMTKRRTAMLKPLGSHEPHTGVRANIDRTSVDVPSSPSSSPSDEDQIRVGVLRSASRPTLDSPLPDSWRARAQAGEMTTGEVIDLDAAWDGYRAWCVDDERRPFTEARWVRWCGDERKRQKERRVNSPTRGATKQPLGNVDPNTWITDTDFAKKVGS